MQVNHSDGPVRPVHNDELGNAVCLHFLERECGKLIFTAARFEKYGQDDRAQQTYREVLLHFPGEDPSGCRKKAQANIVSAQTA